MGPKLLELNETIQEPEINYENIDIIPRLDADSLAYSVVYENFLLRNKPGILRGVMTNWNCSKYWVKNDTLNVDYFKENYGATEVPVSNCWKKWYNIQEKCTMVLNEYLAYWNQYQKDHTNMDCLYLKDWHFTRDFPKQNMYRVPSYFASDWLNEYHDNNNHLNDDFRFVYIGPKNSWTPFHADVLTSFSWSANICGRKKWILFPPGAEECFKDEMGHLTYDIDLESISLKNTRTYEIIQEKGEIVFVPSDWHHQVWNLDDAVSINHNWINACNIFYVWESLKRNLCDVKREISDCRDSENWKEDCQKLLAATFGFNYYKFYNFLNKIATIRVEKLKRSEPLVVYGDWHMGRNHMIFDLKRILRVLKLIIIDEDFLSLNFKEENPYHFTGMLDNFLNNEVETLY